MDNIEMLKKVKKSHNFALKSILIGASTISLYQPTTGMMERLTVDGRRNDFYKIKGDFSKAFKQIKSELKVG